jgi:hypothetical protein
MKREAAADGGMPNIGGRTMPPGVSAAAAAAKAAVENGLGKVGIDGCPKACIGFAPGKMKGIRFCETRDSPSAGRLESGGENSDAKVLSLFLLGADSCCGEEGGECGGLEGS